MRPEGRPVVLTVSNGELHRDDGQVYSEVEGVFAGICRARYKGHPYWFVGLEDRTNTLLVAFNERSAAFKDLVVELAGAEFGYLLIQPYAERVRGKVCTKLGIYADGKRCCPPYVELPPIRRVRDAKGLPYHCDYSARLERLAELAAEINISNARA